MDQVQFDDDANRGIAPTAHLDEALKAPVVRKKKIIYFVIIIIVCVLGSLILLFYSQKQATVNTSQNFRPALD
jgi:t-SNARE complex subunit (syntaxin)